MAVAAVARCGPPTRAADGAKTANGGAVKVMAAASQWTTFLVPLRPARVDLLPGNAGCRPSWLDLPALVYDGTKFCNGVVLGTIGVGAILRLLPQPTSTCFIFQCSKSLEQERHGREDKKRRGVLFSEKIRIALFKYVQVG
ncbi:uncharacterized protein [Oryza sativa Japonica Group]|uniref:uncharacterized protein isoform X2 n=1 Tax=Oryza sativa subsp. japonica TaxID=39947 RepID=UPI00339C5794